jgi:opacity protein-like surface antigen
MNAMYTRQVFLSLVVCVSAFSWVAPTAWAEIREDGAPGSALSLGDAVAAQAVGATALYFNPAGMSRVQQYAIETGYNFAGGLEGHTFSAAAVDSKTNGNIAMGLGYAYVSSTLSGEDRDGNVIRGALSTGYRSRDFSVFAGIGGRYSTLIRGEEDTEDNSGSDDIEFFTLDAGLMAEFSGVFSLGLVGRNLIDTKNLQEAPRTIGVGVGGQLKELSVSADLNVDLQSEEKAVLAYGVGAQLLVQNMVVVRVGYNGGGLSKTNYISAGLAYVSKLVGADFAFRQSIDGASETSFSLALKVFMP